MSKFTKLTIEDKNIKLTEVQNLINSKNSEYRKNKEWYNCMGWALDIKEWLRPVDYGDAWDRESYINDLLFQLDYNEDQMRDLLLHKEVKALINKWGCRLATAKEIEDENFPLIAFREQVDLYMDDDKCLRCYDTDFHFRKRINGIWTEKMGCCPIRICIDEINDVWCGGYDRDIVYLVKES